MSRDSLSEQRPASGAYRALVALTLAAAIAGALLLTPAGVAAQEQTPGPGGNVSVDVDIQDGRENAQQLSDSLEVVSAAYDDSSGFAVIVVRSERPNRLTFTDAGAFFQGGEINVRQITVDADEKTRIRMRVTESDGFVGVGITTAEGRVFAVPIDEDRDIFDGSPTWSDVRLSTLAGLAGGLLVTVGIAYQRVSSGREEVERVI
jgi:hypothetical protein